MMGVFSIQKKDPEIILSGMEVPHKDGVPIEWRKLKKIFIK